MQVDVTERVRWWPRKGVEVAREMSGADMRVALGYLGFTLDSFSKYAGRDLRDLKRMQSGKLGVSGPVRDNIEALEADADAQLADWVAQADRGEVIVLPKLNFIPDRGELPPHWELSLAGRLREIRPRAEFVWSD